MIEGNGRFYLNENIRFLYIALGSLYETEGHIILANDIGYIEDRDSERVKEQIEIVAKLLNGFIRSIKNQKSNIKESVNSEQIAVN
ncbi:hypothetical protein COY62_00105 [bacterium (Candidatus Howlettbacteria) CG_4_10_14_0_8_um_filter_40_9]|nr:MAG: hypothetical protein COY62_00105 [bacterium (Candidatus Howlettbacteria) CG_4_10_14_0_8_um_filter_40_9]